MSCNKGNCVGQYLCNGAITLNDTIKMVGGGESISPYVSLYFGDPYKPTITVGNKSSPQWDNTAIIKSFSYGSSTGAGAKIEILDQQGGPFHLFADKLSKCIEKASSPEYEVTMEWGWVIRKCNGGLSIIRSPRITLKLINIEVNLADGGVKYMLTATDTMQFVFAARHEEIKGSDDAKISIRDAIIKLGQDKEPRFRVRFLRRENDGTEVVNGFKWKKTNDIYGPLGTWECDGQNKLATIRKWIEPYVTDRDRGIIVAWDTSRPNTVVIMEDPTIRENNTYTLSCLNQSIIGAYIVNGGSCSPVLSFSPQINWIASISRLLGTGGNSGSVVSGKSVEKTKPQNIQSNEAGTARAITVTRTAIDNFGKNAVIETEQAQVKHDLAQSNTIAEGAAIEAELRVQGDCRSAFINPASYIGKYVSIVVINPFHLFGNGNVIQDYNGYGSGLSCGDWLANPGCNEVLSNRKWLVLGASHDIKEGSYVTTLKVKLLATGIEIPPDSRMGGPGSMGYIPKNTC